MQSITFLSCSFFFSLFHTRAEPEYGTSAHGIFRILSLPSSAPHHLNVMRCWDIVNMSFTKLRCHHEYMYNVPVCQPANDTICRIYGTFWICATFTHFPITIFVSFQIFYIVLHRTGLHVHRLKMTYNIQDGGWLK